jgi:hypothetical protein
MDLSGPGIDVKLKEKKVVGWNPTENVVNFLIVLKHSFFFFLLEFPMLKITKDNG